MLKRFNYYGKWVFDDIIGLSNGIAEGDAIVITKKKGDMVFGTKEDGTPVDFHHTYLIQGYFVRPQRLSGGYNENLSCRS
ncbi:MAG: hypothetical protein IMZ47_03160 [Firmicutes bacterium]|nr:hypothetical protein [Bacillota bacterium]